LKSTSEKDRYYIQVGKKLGNNIIDWEEKKHEYHLSSNSADIVPNPWNDPNANLCVRLLDSSETEKLRADFKDKTAALISPPLQPPPLMRPSAPSLPATPPNVNPVNPPTQESGEKVDSPPITPAPEVKKEKPDPNRMVMEIDWSFEQGASDKEAVLGLWIKNNLSAANPSRYPGVELKYQPRNSAPVFLWSLPNGRNPFPDTDVENLPFSIPLGRNRFSDVVNNIEMKPKSNFYKISRRTAK